MRFRAAAAIAALAGSGSDEHARGLALDLRHRDPERTGIAVARKVDAELGNRVRRIGDELEDAASGQHAGGAPAAEQIATAQRRPAVRPAQRPQQPLGLWVAGR